MIRKVLGPIGYFLFDPKSKIWKVEAELRDIEGSEKKKFYFKIRNGVKPVKNCTLKIESEGRGRFYGKKNIGSLKPFRSFEEEACEVYEEKVQNLTFKFEVNGYPQEVEISL